MYIITFYSYKGGVGRTMALANVATLLAQKGKRVLLVDFDLEAPSLPNYGGLSDLVIEHGLVDYISAYRETGKAPDVAEHIYKCDQDGNPIWIMPAGDTLTNDYSRKLASIDWRTLYEEEKGYFFFEDLKQQWQMFEQKGFDYVLIDSRTGHTDVGGICTRHLPDLVVAMYLPTMQNISGMAPIIGEIRNERSRASNPVELVFCASNVPELDDEQQILSDLLNTASDRLDYEADTLNIVHHYGSLHVLSHAIFVKDRPNSRLAKEYNSLARSIISHNLEDADGAKLALQTILREDIRNPHKKSKNTRDVIAAKVDQIFSRHRFDGDISNLVARVRSAIGDFEGEISALSNAIELGDGGAGLRGRRARAYQAINMTDRSVDDLRYILRHERVTGAELTAALRMLERTDKQYDDVLDQLLDRVDLDLPMLNSIAEVAQRNRRHLRKFADHLTRTLARHEDSETEIAYANHHLGLALIGCSRFDEAVAKLDTTAKASKLDLPTRFNHFIALWGESGKPNIGIAHELREIMSIRQSGKDDANFLQCQAVINVVLGDHQEALAALYHADEAAQSLGGRIFSCSSYLYLDTDGFVKENEELRSAIEENGHVTLSIFNSSSQN